MLDYSLEVKQGTMITFCLQVTNSSETEQRFSFRSSQEADFAVEQAGQEVWRWSGDRAFALLMQEKNLRSGQALSPYQVQWPKQDATGCVVQPGKYLVKAYFLGASRTTPVAQCEFQIS